MNYESAVEYINGIPKFTTKNKLEHTKMFMECLGIKQDKMKIIHVAGTNGKGTICAMTSSILNKCGKTNGLFTSPHLVKINERICINGQNISDEEFLSIFIQVKEKADMLKEKGVPHPSYFEFLFLMAMLEFYKCGVEYVVLETGLGGRLDATNSVEKPVLTMISAIGMDHMEYLGNTIKEIAGEKAGIIKEGANVVFWGEDKEVCEVVENAADLKNSSFIKVDKANYKITKKTDKSVAFSSLYEYYLNETFLIPFISEYQVMNASVVLAGVSTLAEIRDNLSGIKDGLSDVLWEGRMEMVSEGVILDGAHNGPGIDEFIKTFNDYECNGEKIILFSVVRDKDYDYMIAALSKTKASRIFITGIDSERGLKTKDIYDKFTAKGCTAKVTLIDDVKEAFAAAVSKKGKEDVLFCVGSLYLIGEIKSCM